MARAKTPTTPAMLAKMALVGVGAPPAETEVAGSAADSDAEAAESTELAEDLREVMPAVSEDKTEASGRPVVVLPLLMKLLTSEGRAEYHDGVLPALKSLAREDCTAGSLMTDRREEGTAVARTETTDKCVGRLTPILPRSEVTDALRLCQVTGHWSDELPT